MSNNKPYLIVIILLSLTLLGLIYLWQARNVPPAEIKLENIPLTLGEWKGEDLPISSRTFEILETKDVLMREYVNSRGERVVLAIVYSGISRGSFHPPEICYLGGGRELLNKGLEEIENGMQVNKLLMQDKAGKEIAWYWFTAGNRVIANYYRQQLFFISDELSHKSQGGALVRVSIRAAGDLQEAEAKGKDFIRQLSPVLLNYLTPKN